MKTSLLRLPVVISLFVLISLSVLSACSLAPIRSVAPTEKAPGFVLPTAVPTRTPTPLPTPTALPSEANRTDIMGFIDDVNYKDGFEAEPGQVIDKQWRVKNAGTCNWGPGYTLRVTNADNELNLQESYDLHPALAGTDLTLRLIFTAPEEPGEYGFQLDPFNADGDKFNFYISSAFVVVNPTE